VGKGKSVWQRVKIFIENPGASNDSWSWDAADGTYPNQYQRDRMVEVKFQPLPNGQEIDPTVLPSVKDGVSWLTHLRHGDIDSKEK